VEGSMHYILETTRYGNIEPIAQEVDQIPSLQEATNLHLSTRLHTWKQLP